MYDLLGVNGNAFHVMGYVAHAMRECRKTKSEIDAYYADAKSDNYDHLLAVSLEMIDKLNEEKSNE
ncbi:MAG: hypothetical protein LBN11_01630 [Tannerella sp.]|jgi:hypothetical protein|nr:hypothetical protein [Tannerella sp.]